MRSNTFNTFGNHEGGIRLSYRILLKVIDNADVQISINRVIAFVCRINGYGNKLGTVCKSSAVNTCYRGGNVESRHVGVARKGVSCYVGNRFAITSAGIGEALTRSASALFSAGNTIDESIALITSANSVVQNPEQVGKMLADYKVA